MKMLPKLDEDIEIEENSRSPIVNELNLQNTRLKTFQPLGGTENDCSSNGKVYISLE